MAPSPEIPGNDGMRAEYDIRSLRGVVRGKYVGRRGRVAKLADDVAAAFPDDDAVNAALREYLRTRAVVAVPTRTT